MAISYDRRAPGGRPQQNGASRSSVQKMGGASGLADVLTVILEKGIVVDAWVRLSIIGIEILTLEIRAVIASVDTYLRYAEAIGLTALAAAPRPEQLTQGVVTDLLNGASGPSDDEILAYLEAHPDGVRLSELQAYFGTDRSRLESILSELVQQALDCDTWQDDIRVVSARPEWITLDVRCKIDAADRTTHFLREITAHLSAQISEDVASAFRELLMNAIEHGGKSDPHKRVRTSILHTARAIIVHIHDPGTGFSLDFLPHAAISNPADSPIRHVEVRAESGKRPGGFGILLTKNLVDELLYNERGNAVLFIKYL